MHDLPLVVFVSWDIDALWLAELASGSDQEITNNVVGRRELGLFSASDSHRSLPFEGLVVPTSGFNSGMEAGILIEPVFLSNIGEIVL